MHVTPPTQVNERELLSAEFPAPAGARLELAFPPAVALQAQLAPGAAALVLPQAGAGAADAGGVAGGGVLRCEQVQQLVGVYEFLWEHR